MVIMSWVAVEQRFAAPVAEYPDLESVWIAGHAGFVFFPVLILHNP